jgi:hypothetical protein
MAEGNKIPVILLSDATGETAERVARSTLSQFPEVTFDLILYPQIRKTNQIPKIFTEFPDGKGIVFFSFASPDMRETVEEEIRKKNYLGIDLMGPILKDLSTYLHLDPETVAGMQYRLNDMYQNRISAMEFTMKHDDGQGISTIHQAEILIFGPSRTGKTPLSMVLAIHGYRVANIPLINGEPIPSVPPLKDTVEVGLTIQGDRLQQYRLERLRRLNREGTPSSYADGKAIMEELELAHQFYRQRGIPVIDVTNKAIEEVAAEILGYYRSHRISSSRTT